VCIGIIVGTIGLSIVFGTALRRPEFFIAGTIVGGISSVLAVVGATAYQSSKGRKILDAAGTVHVACPNCGYSMSGLDTCSCPECGSRYALDALIRLQGYEALSQSALKAPTASSRTKRPPRCSPSRSSAPRRPDSSQSRSIADTSTGCPPRSTVSLNSSPDLALRIASSTSSTLASSDDPTRVMMSYS
jgi:predicted RNA-binding Zn-ribbon protein involved in translation (DUF1610 family)